MAVQLDSTALSAVTKQKYTQRRFNLLCFPDNPLFALIPKITDFGGKNKVIGVRNAVPQGRGPSIAIAQAAKTASIYNGFVVTRAFDYGTATITGEAIKAAKGDENTLIEGLTKEIDGTIHNVMRNLAICMYRNGGGQRGQISTATSFTFPGLGGATISVGVAQTVVQLVNFTDAQNFEPGMQVGLSADDGTGGAGLRTGGVTMVTITNVDRDNGLLTANVAWNTITLAAASDFIFQGAPGVGSDYNAMVKGLAAWVPLQPPSSTDNFFAVNRSSDTRLFGLRQVGGGAPIEETVALLATKISLNGGKPSHLFMNPLDWAQLVIALSTKALYPREKVAPNEEPDIGFEAVSVYGPKGPIKVIADLNCPKGLGYMLQLDTWHLESLGEAPMILDQDGLTILRNPNADAFDVRIGYYANVTCEAPIWNGVASW
jgi:hypothetical protein